MISNSWRAAGFLVLLTIAGTAAAYPSLPGRVPIHWNIHGQVDGYGSPESAFLLPGVMAAMLGVFAVLPRISPRNYPIDAFAGTYAQIVLISTGLFSYIQAVTLAVALGLAFPMSRVLIGGLLLFVAALGNLLGRLRPNFFVGIRTPWTLANERVWNETHRLAAWMFVACGFGGAVAVFAGLSPVIGLVAIFVAAFVPVAYSLILYRQLARGGQI